MKGMIYKIINNATQEIIYVGSTKQKYLSMRIGDHRKPSNCSSMPLYNYIKDNGGWVNFSFFIIKEFEFQTDEERFKEERKHIDVLSPLCNIYMPYRTDEEKKSIMKEKRKRFRDNHPGYYKRYVGTERYIKNVEIRCNTIITCECGGTYFLQNKTNHMKLKYHKQFIETGETKPPYIIECFKQDLHYKTYYSINEIYSDLNLSKTAICNNLNGRSKSCGGYVFQYSK